MKFGVVVVKSTSSVSVRWFDTRSLDLPTLHELVGGFVEVVRLGNLPEIYSNVRLLCDEDGKGRCKPVNVIASALYGNPRDVIVGDVVFCCFDESPVPDVYALEEPECSALYKSLSGFSQVLKKRSKT